MQTNFVGEYEGSLRRRVYKRLTLALFFILPARLTSVFVSLSIISLIFNLRDKQLSEQKRTVERIGRLLNMHLNDKVLMLPQRTCEWYWSVDVLDEKLRVGDDFLSVREMVTTNRLFVKYRHTIVSHLLNCLPKSIALKLQLSKVDKRLALKHGVISAMLYA